ncbi:MAG: hypothetical protein GY877_01335 [Hyphomicrobium sp.]|nr:hypothetical protein [Hyphomicrobium sp.]
MTVSRALTSMTVAVALAAASMGPFAPLPTPRAGAEATAAITSLVTLRDVIGGAAATIAATSIGHLEK